MIIVIWFLRLRLLLGKKRQLDILNLCKVLLYHITIENIGLHEVILQSI